MIACKGGIPVKSQSKRASIASLAISIILVITDHFIVNIVSASMFFMPCSCGYMSFSQCMILPSSLLKAVLVKVFSVRETSEFDMDAGIERNESDSNIWQDKRFRR